jgi:beta-lactamase class A
MEDLARELNQFCDETPFTITWYVKDLRTGEDAGRDAHKIMPSASTRKISIMMAALNQIHQGKVRLDDRLLIDETAQSIVNNGGGPFKHFKPGFTITVYDALVMMVILSDNTSTGKIVDTVGLDNVNAFCQSIGMERTCHRFNVPPTASTPIDHPIEATNSTTAADVGLLLDLTITGTRAPEAAARLGLSPELCQLAVDIMSWQLLAEKMPALLPPEASVAHKTGKGRRNANDAGIVFENGEPRFIIAIYLDGAPMEQRDGPTGQTAANDTLARLCRAAWDALVELKASTGT